MTQESRYKESAFIFWLSYYFFKILVKVFYRGKCYNRDNLPAKGPYVAAINHNSLMDIPGMTLAIKQRGAAMAKHTLFDIPILGWWLWKVGMFPVKRGESDQASFDFALNALRKGYVLYIAPEGTRKHEPGSPPRPHTGFIRLAQEAHCPIVPIALCGTREALPPGAKFLHLSKIAVNVGKPIFPEKIKLSMENRNALQQQANEIMQAVYHLRNEIQANRRER
ncbi:MAG: lysophospholipid acyltransferase family protein [bacterium]